MRHGTLIILAAVLAAGTPAVCGSARAAQPPAEEPSKQEAASAEFRTAEPSAEKPAEAEAPAEKPPEAETPAEKPAEGRIPAEMPAEGEQPQEKPKGEGPRELRLDDIRDLPILKRYDLPFEKGEALLGDVKDETFGYDESAFWWVVSQVGHLPTETFEPHAVTTGFSQLMALPSSFRGKLVTIRGMYLTCSPFETPILAIKKDIPNLYECNIRELPMNEARPVATIICLEDPMDYLYRGDIVKVRGFFYKVRAYQGSKGPGLAPMLITDRLVPENRRLPVAGGEEEGGVGRGLLAAGGTTCVVLMVAAILVLGGLYFYLRLKTKASPHAPRERPGHRIRLRRPGGDQPPADARPGDEGGRPQP